MIVFCFVNNPIQAPCVLCNLTDTVWSYWKVVNSTMENSLQFMTPSMIINIYATGASNSIPRPSVIYKVFSYLSYVNNRNLVRKLGLGHHLVQQFMKKQIHLAGMKKQEQWIADSMKEEIYISAWNWQSRQLYSINCHNPTNNTKQNNLVKNPTPHHYNVITF